METLIIFREWLEDEIAAIEGARDEDSLFIHGKLSEAIRIRAMLCQIDKECNKDVDKER